MAFPCAVAALGVAAVLLLAASPAHAGYAFVTKWGGKGSGKGEFKDAFGVSTNSAGSRVYVADTGNHRVQEFRPDGTFIRKWGGQGNGSGEFGGPGPGDVDVSPAGSVWVTDPGNNRVEKFTSTGGYLFHVEGGDGAFDYPNGVATNPDGDAYVADLGNERIERFTGTGTFLTHWDVGNQGPVPNDSPNDVAVDSSGNVWVALCGVTSSNAALGTVAEYGVSGSFIRQWEVNPDRACALGIDVTPSGRILLAANKTIQEYARSGTRIKEFGIKNAVTNDVTTDAAGTVYVTTNFHVFEFRPSPPKTTITSGPSGLIGSSDVSFDYAASESASTFQCKLDSQKFKSCSPNGRDYSGLSDGDHTFEVRAIDADGFKDPTPATRTFTVDTTPPQTTIESGPANGSVINDATPTFGFKSSESGSKFACAIEGASGPYSPCSSPYTASALADGQYVFEVYSTDKAGNSDSTPATRAFTVDTTARVSIPPNPITLTPAGVADVSVTCPASEVSGGCGGTLALATHNQVMFNGQTKRWILGGAKFLIASGQTKVVPVQLSTDMQQLVAANDPLPTDAIANVRDGLGNTGKTTQTFNLSAP